MVQWAMPMVERKTEGHMVDHHVNGCPEIFEPGEPSNRVRFPKVVSSQVKWYVLHMRTNDNLQSLLLGNRALWVASIA